MSTWHVRRRPPACAVGLVRVMDETFSLSNREKCVVWLQGYVWLAGMCGGSHVIGTQPPKRWANVVILYAHRRTAAISENRCTTLMGVLCSIEKVKWLRRCHFFLHSSTQHSAQNEYPDLPSRIPPPRGPRQHPILPNRTVSSISRKWAAKLRCGKGAVWHAASVVGVRSCSTRAQINEGFTLWRLHLLHIK